MTTAAAPPATEPLWLTDVRLRALRRVLWCRELWARHHYAGEQSLAIAHSEVELALASPAATRGAEREFHISDEVAQRLSAEIEALHDDRDPRWDDLVLTLGLPAADAALLALALAAELDPAMRRVYGYLQDDVSAVDPSPALVAALWELPAPPRIGEDCALRHWALARPLAPGREPLSSATGWVADPEILHHVLDARPPEAGGPLGRRVDAPAGPPLRGRMCDDIVNFVLAMTHAAQAAGTFEGVRAASEVERAHASGTLEIELVAPAGAGKATLAAQVAQRLGRTLVAVDARVLRAQTDPVTAVIRETRHALLDGAALLVTHAELLSQDMLAAFRRRAELTFLATTSTLAAGDARSTVRRSYALPALDRDDRLRLWSAIGHGPAPEPVSEWALRPAEVAAVARVAEAGDEAARDVCRRMLLDAPRELLSPVALPYRWDDLVVAPQVQRHLHELADQARARGEVLDAWGFARLTSIGRGLTALFSGPSGTGKTMAAQVLARELGLELYRVDLAGVVNKYIGETEKHLRTVFDACERAPVMLFFDEADALFGKRTQVNDAHDRFANIEIDYVLQRMEQFDGLAVLATNRKGDLDPAFLRRLRFTIDFQPPTAEDRERLWRLALEGSVSATGRALVEPLDWPALARELDLTGAGIKSAALAAAFLARGDGTAITARHVVAAARRELEKQGVVVRAGGLERG
jgi:hypothetical protein